MGIQLTIKPAPSLPPPGSLLGWRGVRLAEPLGQGTLGVTWRGELSDGTAVALKRIRLGGEEKVRLVDRLRRAAEVRHPSLVEICDLFQHEEEVWVAFRLEAGLSLAALLEKGPLRPACAVAVGMAVLNGLSALHQAGLRHGAVHARNVHVDPEGAVRLSDYAIASDPGGGSLAADVRAAGALISSLLGGAAADGALAAAARAMAASRRRLPAGSEAVHASLSLWEAAGRLAGSRRQAQARQQLAALVGGGLQPAAQPAPGLPRRRPGQRQAVTPLRQTGRSRRKSLPALPPPPSNGSPAPAVAPCPARPRTESSPQPRPPAVEQVALMVAAARALEGRPPAARQAPPPTPVPSVAALATGPGPGRQPSVWPVWLAALVLLVAVGVASFGTVSKRLSGAGSQPRPGAVAIQPTVEPAATPSPVPSPTPVPVGEAALPAPTPELTPFLILPPSSAGDVSSVTLSAQACVGGGSCQFQVEVRLRPAPVSRPVVWTVNSIDLCSGATQRLASGVVLAQPGWTHVIAFGQLSPPRNGPQALVATTDSPAQAASSPLMLGSVAVRCPPGG